MTTTTRASRARRSRGFTMVELLAAMAAGMMVAMGAFTFARAATRSFQQEARVANATSAVLLGFRRLSADVQRAGFLATPNIQREFRWEQDICEDPSAAPLAFKDLASIRLERGGTYVGNGLTPTVDLANQVAPDRLTLTGSFDTTEMFFVSHVNATGGNSVVVQLMQNSGAVSRAVQPGANGQPSLGTSIQVGRIGRLIDTAGMIHFGVITAVAVNAGAAPQITLGGSPQIAVQGTAYAGTLKPGCKGVPFNSVGALFSVVNRVVYEVRDLRNDPAYAALYPAPNSVSTDDAAADPPKSRHELVRYEIGVDGAQLGPNEVVAEYAVDFRFGATIDTAPVPAIGNGNPYQPLLTTYDVGNPAIYPYTNTASQSVVTPGPERIRSLRVRLAVRSREGDREANVAPALQPITLQNNTPGSGGQYRYLLSNGSWARVRTMQSEISLPNNSVFW